MHIESITLAAGKGTRMKSRLPKVLHPVAAYPILGWIMDILDRHTDTLHVVVGHSREKVVAFLDKHYPEATISVQREQNGTGGALIAALENVNPESTHLLVTAGDTPLIHESTIENLINELKTEKADVAVLSTLMEDPGHYGRIKRFENGQVEKIVEYLDATEAEREICEINSGVYIISTETIKETLPSLSNDNAKGEYYLTDIIELAGKAGKKVIGVVEKDSVSLSGINSKVELAEADMVMQKRLKTEFMREGVYFLLPETTYIERGAEIGTGTSVQPCCYISSYSRISEESVVPHGSVVTGNFPS